MRKLAIIGILSCLLSSAVEGAVLRVEKDGTGDYTVIQDAVDAAEDGDTVLIGPGRYTEVHDFEYYYGRITQVCITLEKSLSIIGAGRGVTVIEPVDAAKTQSDPGGIASRSSDLDVFLSDFTIENTPGHAILYDMDSGGRVEITRVGISNCFSGINVKRTMNSHIFECDIQTTIDRGIWAWRVDGLLVENCSFQDDGIDFYEAQNSEIFNCQTSHAEIGMSMSSAIISPFPTACWQTVVTIALLFGAAATFWSMISKPSTNPMLASLFSIITVCPISRSGIRCSRQELCLAIRRSILDLYSATTTSCPRMRGVPFGSSTTTRPGHLDRHDWQLLGHR